MKLLLDQGEKVRHGLETQVMELQDKLKQAQGPEAAKEVLMKVGRRVGIHCVSHVQLCSPMACSLPGSSVQGILQSRILEWVAIPFSRGIFPTQGSNPGLLLCRFVIVRHQGKPRE